MIELNKGERSLWQMPLEMLLMENNSFCDVECFMLTSQNVRIQYWEKLNKFKKELREIVLPIESLNFTGNFVSGQYSEGSLECKIVSAHKDYEMRLYCENKDEGEEQIREFVKKVSVLVKNG